MATKVTGDEGEARKYMRDDMRDYYDSELKQSNYLLASHAAGIIGCLTTIKDYSATPQLKGVGIFIVIFVVGFVLASMGTWALFIARSEMMTWITHGGKKPKGQYGAVASLSLSLLLLFVALGWMAYKLAGL